MELFKASAQWSSRPADERFWDIPEMIRATRAYRAASATADAEVKDLRVEARDNDLHILGRANAPARLTHYAFGQIARKAKAPTEYLRGLPATLAAQNLNHGLKQHADDGIASLLFHKPTDPGAAMTLRCALTPTYKRIWNHEILERLMHALPDGWQVPPARPAGIERERTRAATEQDVLRLRASNGLSISVGDAIAPAGLYASDHDMFVFMVNEAHGIDDGTGHQLGRGFFLWNSEVGDSSFGVTTFLYDAICGNHIVWGAKDVREVRIRHVGNGEKKAFGALRVELLEYADDSASDLEAKIKAARAFELGTTKDDAIEALLGLAAKQRIRGLTQTLVTDAYAAAERSPRYGNPRTLWAMVNGITEESQRTAYADTRVTLDRAAGELLRVAF